MALDYFGKQESLGVTMKGAQDWLTVADGAVEDFLRQRLAVLFPTDTVIGEEGGGAASDAVWIIDPIDGTSNLPAATATGASRSDSCKTAFPRSGSWPHRRWTNSMSRSADRARR